MMKRFTPQVLIAGVIFTLSISATFAQPVSAFTANKTSGCSPLVVTFQNLSVNAVAYEWDTGISSSTLTHPTVLYTNPGTYQVMLVAIDAQGQRDTVIQPSYITVYANPVVNFAVSQAQVCAHTAVTFTDVSMPGSGGITQWNWDFGDGQSSQSQHPVHTYTEAGSYPVSLQVTNQHGCSHSVLKPAMVAVLAPDPEFTASQTVACGAPLPVTFQPVPANGVTHAWTFGDGGNSTQLSPLHTYLNVGTYDVGHIVTDGNGCKDTLVKTSFINIGANTLSAFAADSSICTGSLVSFTAQAPPSSQVTWNFGDGNTGIGTKVGHLYQAPGNYTVEVQINAPSGCQATRVIPMTVSQTPLPAFTVADTTVGCGVPFQVQFVNQSVGAVAYSWGSIPGALGYQANPLVTYNTVDSFTISLTAFGPGGCAATLKKTNYIKIIPTEPGFQSDITAGCAPISVTFEDTSHSYYPIIARHWDFGDGTTGTGPTPAHVYNAPGLYDIRLITTNSQGCQDTVLMEDYLQIGTKPNAQFVADTTRACALGDVQFTNLTTNGIDYIWYFGDGDTAMSVNPTHGFAALGQMDVKLVAFNQGCSDTLLLSNYIEVLSPLPVIGMTGRYICQIPETVQFINLSIDDDDWLWTLPDGSTSTDSITPFNFTQPGQYPVSLKVINYTTGCEVEITDSVYVRPIEADFLVTPPAGCAPLATQFQAQSPGAIEYTWVFGDGTSSSLPNPSKTYPTGGYYQVSLTVENEYGCKDTKTLDTLRVSQFLPQILTNSPTQGCTPLSVSFQQGTGLLRGTQIIGWLWEFGDGSISTLKDPTHVYTQPGTYTVKLTTTDDLGCTSVRIFSTPIIASDPQPQFSVVPAVACPGSPVSFISSSTGIGLNYQWQLGDGNTSVQANPSHAYASPGVYDLTLTIGDIFGCSRSISQPAAVTVAPLFAAFTADTTYAPCPPLNVQFQAQSGFPHPGLYFQWDFGNGSTGSTPQASALYTQPGTYDVSLIVGAVGGCSDTMLIEDMIVIEGPSASFTFTPGEGCPGTQIDFLAASPDSVTYRWIYGDGDIGSQAASSHVYQDPGTYLPVLIIEDRDGCTVFTYARNPVTIFTPPTAQFTPTTVEACDSLVQVFDAGSSSGSIISWNWDFGPAGTSTQAQPPVLFAQPGTYDVTLTVTDQHGCSDTTSVTDVITIHPSPDPVILPSDVNGCLPFTLTVEGLPNGHSAAITSWAWTSGSQTHNGAVWQPVFTDPGFHTINLLATDEHGCSAETTLIVEVFPLPEADFTVSDQESCAPAELLFTDQTPGAIVSWEWMFGDGFFGAGRDPVHVYLNNGTYDVTVMVQDANGCRDTLTKPAFVNLESPFAAFSVSDTVACPGSLILFSDESQSRRPIVSWDWAFGDTQTSQGSNTQHRYGQSGIYDVTLLVTDDEGCTGSITLPQYIRIQDDVPAEPVQMIAASVVSDEAVELTYERYESRLDDFGAYVIYRSVNGIQYQAVDSVSDQNQTTYVDHGLNTLQLRYWYKVVPHNLCGNPAPWDAMQAHATVQLETFPGLDQATLSWTRYLGWQQVDRYEIYRVTGYEPGNQMFLGSVSGTDSSFLDLGYRCDENHHYRVVAFGNSTKAASDSSFTDPFHEGPQIPTDVIRATVENNSSVLVEWNEPPVDMADRVIVERSSGSGFVVVADLPVGAAKSSDPTAKVTKESYVYRVATIDSCGDATPMGLTGKTILLSAQNEFSGNRLSWTPYEGWVGGVEGYVLEVFDESLQAFRVVAQLAGNTTAYFDQATILQQGTYCYRVTAWEWGGGKETSQSNEACVTPSPYLYLPNAFSPNGDGINDAFGIGLNAVGSFQLDIYDRWGKLMFSTSSQEDPWLGYTAEGMAAPEGVYVFKLVANGYSGETLVRSGTVTLVR